MDLQELAQAVIEGNRDRALELTKASLAEGCAPENVLREGLIAGMNVVGEKFKNNEFYIPEVLIAARAMKTAMEELRPLLADSDVQPEGHVVVGTVRGDLHDIGKNLVVMMLEGAGFAIHDLGVDCTPEQFIEEAKNNDADIIAMSALLTTTMPSMKETVDAVRAAGLSVKTMIGGAPVTQDYADSIGADGYAPDAASAVDKAKELIAA